jgi:hypothetical protein
VRPWCDHSIDRPDPTSIPVTVRGPTSIPHTNAQNVPNVPAVAKHGRRAVSRPASDGGMVQLREHRRPAFVIWCRAPMLPPSDPDWTDPGSFGVSPPRLVPANGLQPTSTVRCPHTRLDRRTWTAPDGESRGTGALIFNIVFNIGWASSTAAERDAHGATEG